MGQPGSAEGYLACPFLKGRPRKHVRVCRSCRRNKRCPAFFRYLQPSLPLRFDTPRPNG